MALSTQIDGQPVPTAWFNEVKSLLDALGTNYVSVQDPRFGALGDGTAGDRARIQSALDHARDNDIGLVITPWTPDFYNTDGPLYMRNGVSFVGVGGRPKIKNTSTDTTFMQRSVIAPGNYHPDYLESDNVSYNDLDAITKGDNTVTLTNSGDAIRYSVGDLVFIRDTLSATAAGFDVYKHGFFNEITAKSGAILMLKYPFDVSMSARIVPANGAGNGRFSEPLFVWKRGVLSNFEFETEGYWTADTATYECLFQDLIVKAKAIIYGNAWQRTFFSKIRGTFDTLISEMSFLSYKSIIDDFDVTLIGGGTQGISIQENARHIKWVNGFIDVSSASFGDGVLKLITASDCSFENINIDLGPNYSTGGSILQMVNFAAATANVLPCERNKFKGIRIKADQFGRFMEINDTSGAGIVRDNTIEDIQGLGTPSADAFRLLTTDKITMRNCFFEKGKGLLSNRENKFIHQTFIGGGFTEETGDVDTFYQANALAGIVSDSWLDVKRLSLRKVEGIFADSTVQVNAVSRDVAGSLRIRDRFRIHGTGSTGGLTGTKSVILAFAGTEVYRKDFSSIHQDTFTLELELTITNTTTIRGIVKLYDNDTGSYTVSRLNVIIPNITTQDPYTVLVGIVVSASGNNIALNPINIDVERLGHA